MCKSSCPLGAIKQKHNVLVVDEEICNGCGECAKNCPYKAIVINDGKAIKCDLCFGEPKCIDYCPEEAIRILKQEKGLLGWKITDDKAEYRLNIPPLTNEEESVVVEIVSLFREISKNNKFTEPSIIKKELENLLLKFCKDKNIDLEDDQFSYLKEICLMQVWGYGPLDILLRDQLLEEIAIIGLNKAIYVYKRGTGWLSTDCHFTDEEVFVNTVNKMARPLGRRLTHQNPRLNAVLPDGSRMHASIPPISKYELTIRKFRENPISIPDLIRYKTFSPESLAFLWLAIKTNLSILIAGNTASGKTSTLNALFSFVPLEERVLIAEETPEINVPHKHKINLISNTDLRIGMKDLVSDSLRMRPDRVIVGEVRTAEETKALIEIMSSGQARGNYATFHADSSEDLIIRMGSLGIPSTDINTIDLIVIQKRLGDSHSTEIRRAFEIAEIHRIDKSIKPNILYEYDFSKTELKRTANDSIIEQKIKKILGLSEKEFNIELKKRSKFLISLSNGNSSFFESVTAIQNSERNQGGRRAK